MKRFIPSLSSLQAFEAAVRHLNFTRAAEEMDLTQSGMSRQIKLLETFLGVPLFERHGPRLILTEVGDVYYKDVATILHKLEEVSIDAVRGRRASAGLLIGASQTLGAAWLSRRIVGFLGRHPEMIVEVIVESNEIDFDRSPADVSVVRTAGPIRGARAHTLFREEIVVVASPKLVPRKMPMTVADFSRFTLIQNAARPRFWLQWLNAVGIEYTGFIQGPRFANSDMAINAAAAGLGVTVAPMIFVEEEITRGRLYAPFGPPVPSGESYALAYPIRKANNAAVKLFRDWLLRETRALRRR